MKKRLRKQPRKLTPPLILRCERDRYIYEVDEVIHTHKDVRSSRTTAFLEFGPGVAIRIGSRCVNKRRVTVLHIDPVIAWPREHSSADGTAIHTVRRAMCSQEEA